MLPESLSRLSDGIGNTPVLPAVIVYQGRDHDVLLKAEWHNPTGSIKDRTAAGLLWSIDREQPLRPGTIVVESTSGNLGMGLARLLPWLGCRMLAVIDPKTPAATQAALAETGAELRMATDPDGQGGYLLARLRIVAELCREDRHRRRTNQYVNKANPLIHELTTGPEIAAQGGDELDAVYVAVSTGGTLGGISAHFSKARPDVRVVAVDLESSYALSPGRPANRVIPGVGASRPSSFLDAGSYHHAVRVREAEALAVCRIFAEDTGLRLGGSSGCTVRACLSDLTAYQPPRHPVCICPDGGASYADTLYDDDWLMAMHVFADVKEAVDGFRAAGLTFGLKG
jgi:cysteine synthase